MWWLQYRSCARFLPFRWSLVRNLLIAASVTSVVTIRPAFASSSSASSKMSESGESYVAGSSSVAFVTTPDRESARKLARSLVEQKLAACVNIVPHIESIYMWEGKVTEDSEFLMMVKTRTSRIDELSKFVRENHPYSVAEVIALPIQNGNPPYLDWIAQTVAEKADKSE
ncbi:divalent-cation tolerance protein CutA [Drosophila takahashii]|uniref:divalent-cation tolerance protein CutA n=1 Tax=Drosophila takahashii TaxID=29030 RepID=UPI001CF901AC|nr:divalent-cation tolerance protein CutA [Drosophila takahashii]